MKTSLLVIRSAIIAALGGLLFGFDTAVISGTVDSLKAVFQLDDWWLGFTVASALFGTILGAATAQLPSNHWGRKPTLIIWAVFYFVSAVGSAFPDCFGYLTTPYSWYSFLFFRFLGGIAVGGASVVSPLYTAEISPAKTRGILVAITQFNIVLGILAAFFSNFIIVGMNLGDMEWRWMFGVEAIPAAAFFFLLFFVPESPRWLIAQNRVNQARPILDALGTDSDNTETEIQIIQNAINEESAQGKEIFFCRRFCFPIFLAICMAAFNQLSGINAILYYAPKVFTIAGASKEWSMFFPVIIGLTNLLFTVAAMFVIDWFGRRKLMLIGSLGYISSLCIVAGAFIIFGDEFNISIKNVAATEAAEKVTKVQIMYDNAVSPDEKQFFTEELEKAKLVLNQANEELQNEIWKDVPQGYLSLRGDTVPMAGILIVLGGLMLFIASHAFGQGACIWVFIGEIFPNKVRAQGQALGSFVHWILAAIITQLFPPLLVLFGAATIFLLFAGMMFLQLLWVIFVMPETKQIPLEEMQKILGIVEREKNEQ
ncbi:MAG: sugar porter family MFS transporter [Planctomycetaceae bacterium]|jgi:sugar porter (SP) family MFS transporter|nr:sugar porter family MFS transporter [Planctomycetaceae bacterium]